MKQFEDKELVLMAQIIDQSSQRGMFKGADLTIVGELYTKTVNMLPKPAEEKAKTNEQK